jgi:hypothetical protein
MSREGKTLQNCIGRNYTFDSCKRDGTSIYIMRDRSHNSCVALRAQKREVQEFKGKNNKPPVDRYMPAVAEFVQQMKLNPLPAQYDFQRAGYYVEPNGGILTTDQALEKYAARKALGQTEDGNQVVQITCQQGDLFGRLISKFMSKSTHYGMSSSSVHYQLQNSKGHVLAAVTCRSNAKEVDDIWQAGEEESGNKKDKKKAIGADLKSLINFLGQHSIIRDVDSDIKQTLPIAHSLKYDSKEKRVSDLTPTQTMTYGEGEHAIEASVYSGLDAKELGTAIINGAKSYYHKRGGAENIDRLHPQGVVVLPKATVLPRHTSSKSAITSLVRCKNGYILPYTIGNNGDVSPSHTINDGSPRDTAIRDAVVNIANKSQSALPLDYCQKACITKRNGQYAKMEIDPIPVTQNMARIDLGDLSEPDKFLATSAAVVGRKSGKGWTYTNDTTGYYHRDSNPFVGLRSEPKDDVVMAPKYNSDMEMAERWERLKNERFGGQSPYALYIPSNTQAVPFIVVVDEHKDIVAIDTYHNLRGSMTGNDRSAANMVIKYVNELIDTEKLKLSRASIRRISTYFAVDRDTRKLKSGVDRISGKLDAAAQDELTIRFDNGATASRMPSDQFSQWQEKLGISNIKNSEFFIVKDPQGEQVAIIAADPKKKKIAKVFTKSARENDDGALNSEAFKPSTAKYVHAFAKAEGYTTYPTNSLFGERSDEYRLLKELATRTKEDRYGKVCRAAGMGAWFSMDSFRNGSMTVARMAKQGLLTARAEGEVLYIGPTEKGKLLWSKIESGEITSKYQIFGSLNAEASRKEIPPPEPTPAAPEGEDEPAAPRQRAPREAGGESKAGRALAKFREMATANGGTIPVRSAFIAILRQEPFNMTPAGASTYYHNIKVKYAQEQGQLGEHFTFMEYLMVFG